ncbi:hypothetical protein ACLI1A_17905 [Flavobacterium sp. RHBU_3]|uniref:hypothetical protein n=1 Tax=Flavobacterium sp. RHBU_3 TaxID=3391184 RepID=UPI003985581F
MKIFYSLLLAGTAVMAQQNPNDVALAENPVQQHDMVQQVTVAKKRTEHTVKPVMHQDNNRLYMSAINMQYAFLVQPDEDNIYLSTLTLPLMKAAFESEGHPGVFEKVGFNTLVKIELLENQNNVPGSKIEGFEQLAIVTNEADAKEFSIKLDKEIALSHNGAFVQLTIVGKSDAEGVLAKYEPTTETYKDANGNDRFYLDYCQPNFPLTSRSKGTLTYVKNPNRKVMEWEAINEPSLHAIKKYPDFNIGFGYTVVSYK